PTGYTETSRSSSGGWADLEVTPQVGGHALWRPTLAGSGAGKSLRIAKPGWAERLAEIRRGQPVLGRLEIDGNVVTVGELPDLITANKMTRKHRLLAELRAAGNAKDGPLCGSNENTCGQVPPTFRAVLLSLDPGDELIEVEIKIQEDGEQVSKLDDDENEVLTDIVLTLEVTAKIRTQGGSEYERTITDPVAISVTDDYDAKIEQDQVICDTMTITPGDFTYWIGHEAGMDFTHYDEGGPCCWAAPEDLRVSVVAEIEQNDGQGGTSRRRKTNSLTISSSPRPADPCEIRPYPPGQGSVIAYAGEGPFPEDTGFGQPVGGAYIVDACGNVLHENQGVNVVSPRPPAADSEGVWAQVQPAGNFWQYWITLHGNHEDEKDGQTIYKIPAGQYDINLQVPTSNSECGGGGNIPYTYSVDYADSRPLIRLHWGSYRGPEPNSPVAARGGRLTNPGSCEPAVWRVLPTESGFWHNEQRWDGVPVKL
ncbi:MAG: hypothetical protein GY867_10125, partial [bacterium]|nr:hypothetical protein [bacterium]